jgi:hypothetical protein
LVFLAWPFQPLSSTDLFLLLQVNMCSTLNKGCIQQSNLDINNPAFLES